MTNTRGASTNSNLEQFKRNLASRGSVHWGSTTSLEFFWQFELKADRSSLWPYLSDTSRMNRELGLAPRAESEMNGQLHVRTKLFGFDQEWVEEPWTWVAEDFICSTRTYKKGIANVVQAVFKINESATGESGIVSVYYGWQPRNTIWSIVLRATENILKDKFACYFKKVDGLIEGQIESRNMSMLTVAAPKLTDEQTAVLIEKGHALKQTNANLQCADLLIDLMQTEDDLNIETIRLIPLAHRWRVDIDDLLITALHATRLGLLKLSWNVTCPHCRGARVKVSHLGEIPESADCSACEIDFQTDLENAIEIVFHVHPSIRTVPDLVYCAAEPAKKSHIRVQQRLLPGAQQAIHITLAEGVYRGRLQGAGSIELEVSDDVSTSQWHIDLTKTKARLALNTSFVATAQIEGERARLLVIEEPQLTDTALRPGRILSATDFRDLFSQEHLKSNVKLHLGEQTILFTDIVGSTNFYKAVGDAKAFSEVRQHFEEVLAEIRNHDGVLVKTIGDAAMAAFARTDYALEAAIQIQNRFQRSRLDTSIRLRISVHVGPVIAVNLDTGVDYFGSTVNLAAKIQSCADAHQIALSSAAYAHWQKKFGDKFSTKQVSHKRDTSRPEPVFVITV